MWNRVASGFVGIIAACTAMVAQTTFEVASVKQNTLDDRIVTIDVGPGDRFAARGYTLVLLMQRAYGVMDWNVTGGPGWIRTDRWDIIAKAGVAGNLKESQSQPRLQALLAERFKLQIHQSTKAMPGYALVVSKSGPKLKSSVDGEERRDTFRMNAEGLTGQGIRLPDLARFVAGKLGFVAVDETALKGVYDFNVTWKVETDPGGDPREALRYAVFEALQEQLGLKLTAKKISVQMLVIDHVEKAAASDN